MTTALSADTSATWTVTDAAGTPLEATSQETGGNAIAGPTTGCTAPREKVQIAGSETVPPTAPDERDGQRSASTRCTLNWARVHGSRLDAGASGVQTYEVFRDAHDGQGPVAVATVQNADGSHDPPTDLRRRQRAARHLHLLRASRRTPPTTTARPRPRATDVTAIDRTAPAPPVPVNDPPAGGHSIIGFPARDFISADGYTDAAKVDVRSHPQRQHRRDRRRDRPQGATGLVEVNHPGGGCWTGTTPYLSPVTSSQTNAKDAAGTAFAIDQTTLAERDRRASGPDRARPASSIHGTAAAADGSQIPLDQIENRLVTSTANAFAVNGKRTIRAASVRAPRQGTLCYDSATSNRWTAKYTGLSADDVTRALGAESRAMWLGRNPAASCPSSRRSSRTATRSPAAPARRARVRPRRSRRSSLDATSLRPSGSVDVVDPTNGSVTKTVTVTNNGRAAAERRPRLRGRRRRQELHGHQQHVRRQDGRRRRHVHGRRDVRPEHDRPDEGEPEPRRQREDRRLPEHPADRHRAPPARRRRASASLAFNTVTAGSPVTKP